MADLTTKPAVGTPVISGHALLPDYAYVINEASGDLVDAVGGVNVPVGTALRSTMAGVSCIGRNVTWGTTRTAIPTLLPPFSVHAGIYVSNGGAINSVRTVGVIGSVTAHWNGINVMRFADGQQAIANSFGAATGSVFPGMPYPYATWFQSTAVFNSGSQRRIYFNGAFGAQNTTSVTQSGIDRILIDGSQNNYVALAYFYRRALSDAEVASLTADPFQFYGVAGGAPSAMLAVSF